MENSRSSITREDGIVRIEKGQAAYSELVGEIAADPQGKVSLDAQQATSVEESLIGLANEHLPPGDGQVSTVIGNTYFDFKEVLFDSLKIAAKAAIAIYISDIGSGVDAAISALKMACTRFSKLNPEEVETYWALVQLAENEHRPDSGFTPKEVISEIEKTHSITGDENIKNGLQHLTAVGVTEVVTPGRYIVTERWVK